MNHYKGYLGLIKALKLARTLTSWHGRALQNNFLYTTKYRFLKNAERIYSVINFVFYGFGMYNVYKY